MLCNSIAFGSFKSKILQNKEDFEYMYLQDPTDIALLRSFQLFSKQDYLLKYEHSAF